MGVDMIKRVKIKIKIKMSGDIFKIKVKKNWKYKNPLVGVRKEHFWRWPDTFTSLHCLLLVCEYGESTIKYRTL